MSLHQLPLHVLQRICQYLMDDPTTYHCWFSGGVQHLLRFRAASRFFDQIVKESFLNFTLVQDFYQAIQEIGDNHLELQLNFLTLVNNEFNWRCTACEIELVNNGTDWGLVQSFWVKLSNFQSMMARKICYLKIDAVDCFRSYHEAINLLNPFLSSSVTIELKIGLEDFRADIASQLILTEHVNKLHVRDSLQCNEGQLSETLRSIWRTFSNINHVRLVSDRPIVWKQLALTESKCKIMVHHLRKADNCNSELEGVFLQNIEHVTIGVVENAENIDLRFIRNHFTNLSSLTIGYIQIKNIVYFDLPRSCTTVKINFLLLKFITNSQDIKNLMVESFAKTSEIPLSRNDIKKFEFQLETFVFISHKVPNTPYADYLSKVILPLLEYQKRLRVLTVDFFDESYIEEESGLFIENYFMGQNDVDDLRNAITKERSVIQAHKHIQFLRLRNVFIVLKFSLTKKLIDFIDDLDINHSWSVRVLCCSGKCDSECVLPLKVSDFTIT